MIRIFQKEFANFLNSLIAYVVIGVFLTAIGLLTWVFPETSVLDFGFADLDPLFSTGPYVFIFLIPAITMKSFAEEKRSGTLELLLTKPLTDVQIIAGKFLASFGLVLVSLAPTVIYYFSIQRLGNPPGNADAPGVMGSYLGLALLGGVFCSVGILASSVTTNQIIAFILAAFSCFLLYAGFESLSSLMNSGSEALLVKQLGIGYHYETLSKGLVDSRDVLYFISVIVFMLMLTKVTVGSRQWQSGNSWKQSRKTGDWLLLANGFVFLLLVNLIASSAFFRIDLTEEKRYTIQQPTREMLKNLNDDVYIEVFLEGDLNPSFRRFQKSIRETLEEFRVYSGNKVHYVFTDPATAMSKKAQNEFMQELANKGVLGKRVIDGKGGDRSEKIIFPGAVVSYGGEETGVMLLKDKSNQSSQQVINQSVEGVEFELASAIQKLSRETRKRIGITTGHGELNGLLTAGLTNALLDQYDTFSIDLPEKKVIPSCDAIIIAKPTKAFSEQDKFKIDHYIMNGGKVIFLLDQLDASMDSASRDDYYAFSYDLKLTDLLFKYGVRINDDLLQDIVSQKYPVVIGQTGDKPEVMLMDWPFFPLISHYSKHPITRNLDVTLTRFISSVDTVKASGIRKTLLMSTSPYSHRSGPPVKIDINDLRKEMKPENYQEGEIPVAWLLEGRFTSLYKNRFLPSGVDTLGIKTEHKPSKIIVVADGDVVRNDVNPRTGQPQALGADPFTGYTFANENLIMNMVTYLVEENGVINARSKEVKIRPLDKEKIKTEKHFWQTLNLGLPLAVLIIFGIVRSWLRKRKYARF
jgi:ABC-2 type transport system permease protein